MNRYLKGKKFEYKIKKDLESQGYIVLRMAGSHGFADLVAIDIVTRTIRFIQCKCGRSYTEKDKLRLEQEFLDLNNIFRCSFEVIRG